MKNKKLSIQGFKSFVDKVTLNFSSGTSAIIGPNGCGKSNIVDAIRWVLGEQNPRHLRGKNMEDIIFNGSSERKPVGMAEVVLTFSNEDGNAPARYANFTEVEISRRLYRSGESEYYINKVQSRLRDIVDLFTDTGIGTRAYSIVEQGQVGWLVNAKPEERRVIFEEAAGINKFKHKKQAALRRLEATRDNLTRVNDIISEVKRQLNSLNRQAKKAERYKVFKDELKDVDLKLGSMEFKRMKDGHESFSARLRQVQDQELAASNAIVTREASSEEIKADYLREENEFKAVRERVFEFERQIQDVERSSALIRMRMEELERNEVRLTEEMAELRDASSRETEEVDGLKREIAELEKTIGEQSSLLNERSEALAGHVRALKEREDSLRAERAASLAVSTRLSDIRHSIQACLKDEENLRVREARARSEREEVSRSLSSGEEPVRKLREGIQRAGEKKGSLVAEVAGIKESLESLEREKADGDVELGNLKAEHNRAAARLATLEEMESSFESLGSGARAIMLKEDKQGVLGIVADCLEANPGFEKAVEAVLGERLQYVIVESQKEGVEAVEYLKANSGGRGSFVPVRDVRQMNPVPVHSGPNQPGARDLIAEVRVKEGYDGIVNYLLGDVLLVDSLEKGVELWQGSTTYKTLVTPEGDIIDPQGIITGGSGASDDGILQKRGEIKRIRSSISVLEERISSLTERLRGVEAGLAGARRLLDEYREKLHAADMERLNLEGELKGREAEQTRLNETLSRLTREIDEASAKLSPISARKATLSEERETLEKELEEKEGRADALASEISAAAEDKDRLANTVTEIKVSLAQANERHGSLRRQVEAKARMIEDTGSRLESRARDIEQGHVEAAGKAKDLEGLKARAEELLMKVDAVKKEEVSRTETLEELDARIKAVETELKGLKEKASEAVELKGELTIEMKEIELKIGNLKERLIEKYGVDVETVPFEPSEAVEAETLKKTRDELQERINALGTVSLSALEEYAELEERHKFLLEQQADLTNSVDSLHKAILKINRTTREKFKTAFEEINEKFMESFPRFFNGGRAELRLTEGTDILEAGVEIVAQPPGKRLQNITLLSGGEKALTATSLIFSIFLTKPSPFCLLDEVDAPLDDANIDRFNIFVKEMAKLSQFLLITHNKKTMEIADSLYGVTMETPGVSKVLTLEF